MSDARIAELSCIEKHEMWMWEYDDQLRHIAKYLDKGGFHRKQYDQVWVGPTVYFDRTFNFKSSKNQTFSLFTFAHLKYKSTIWQNY